MTDDTAKRLSRGPGNWGHRGNRLAPTKLSPRRKRFVIEYLAHGNATRAAIAAGYSEKSAGQIGYQNLQMPLVNAAIQMGYQKLAEKAEITSDEIIGALKEISRADPAELIQYLRVNCRFCWGNDHRRQYTPEEQRGRRAVWDCEQRVKSRGSRAKGEEEDEPLDGLEFDEEGGVGWNAYREPHPACPECAGQGETKVHVVDTRTLSPGARSLYRGVKVTKQGIEVLMEDRGAALVNLGRHLGLFKDKTEVEHKGNVTFIIEDGPVKKPE